MPTASGKSKAGLHTEDVPSQGSEQSARFLATARALGADKDEGALDRVFGKVVPPVLPKAAEKDGETDEEGTSLRG